MMTMIYVVGFALLSAAYGTGYFARALIAWATEAQLRATITSLKEANKS